MDYAIKDLKLTTYDQIGSLAFVGGDEKIRKFKWGPCEVNLICDGDLGYEVVEKKVGAVEPESMIIDNEDDLIIYPNPVDDEFNFVYNGEKRVKSIEVYDIAGQLIIIEDNETNKLDTKTLNSGVYVLRLVFDDSVLFKKFVKK